MSSIVPGSSRCAAVLVTAALCSALPVACSSSNPSQDAGLSMPLGLAIAGELGRDLFIAQGGDASLKVIEFGSTLKKHEWVPSATQFFPLQIPAGARPQELAATRDGAWLLSLDSLANEIYLIDALRRVPQLDANDEPVRLPLGGADAGARSLVRATMPCAQGETCPNRFYVALTRSGLVVAVDVVDVGEDMDGRKALVPGPTYAVGGEPNYLATTPDGALLFASDTASTEVVRVDLASGLIDRTDVGAVPGPLGVSTDGRLLLVTRPAWRDLVVLRGIDAAILEIVDVNAPAMPTLGCLRRCDEADPAVCADAHPADRAVCNSDDGLHADLNYPGLYLGGIPTALVTLGAGGGQAALSVSCQKPDPLDPKDPDKVTTVSQEHGELALVLTHPGARTSGTVHFIQLDASESAGPVAALVNSAWCREPGATVEVMSDNGREAIALEEYLELAPVAPLDRASYIAPQVIDTTGLVIASSPDFGRVLLEPGVGASGGWQFEWEPTLVDHDTGGDLGGDGSFTDGATDFAALGVQAGDYVEILSLPLAGVDSCRDGLPDAYLATGEARACALERRVGTVSIDGQRLVFDDPLPASCFRAGSIAYRIRVGGSFVLSAGVQKVRIAPGTRFGAGGALGERSRAIFRLKDLGFVRDPVASWNACDAYDEAGAAIGEHHRLLSRGRVFGFTTYDGFAPVVAGDGPAGYLPAAMTVAPMRQDATWGTTLGANMPPVFISYAGSALVMALVPYDTAKLTDSDRRVLLR